MSKMITYQLFMHVSSAIVITVGRLGTFNFPCGDYVYTGSAKTNIDARIARHLQREKKLHWHIDYLLASDQVRVDEVLQYAEPECTVNQQAKGIVVVNKFGASDCQHNCGSHLKRLTVP